MKISEFPSEEEFCIRDCIIANTPCKLVFPHQNGIKWTDENKIFRSSIWTNQGELVSASWKKFTNLGEQIDFEPLLDSYDVEYITKIDGSTLAISYFNGELIVRTRGTADAEAVLENGYEIPFLKQKYPLLFDNKLLKTEQFTILTEWYSPKNIIVEREATEPTLWLTGVVKHEDYSYLPQDEIDDLAKFWGIERPKRHKFTTLAQMTESVKNWSKGEGIVLYANNGQILKKAKADRYLYLHRIKSALNHEKNLLEFYVDKEMPSLKDFCKIIETEFDFEIAQDLNEQIQKICEAGEKTKKFIDNLLEFVHDIRSIATRKEQAQYIMQNYRENASFAFSILDGKAITKEQWNKLITQKL